MPSRRGFLRGIALSLFVAVGFVALLEFASRLLLDANDAGILVQRPTVKLYPGIDRPEEIFSEVSPDTLEWAPYEHWTMRPNLRGRFFRTNSLGLRGEETFPEKPPGRIRIAVLGGSAAWGLGATADDKTVPARLEAILRDRHPDRRIEVLNAAQVGYVTAQELIYFHRKIKALGPDVVVLLNGYNDINADFGNPETGWPQQGPILRARYEASWSGLPAKFYARALLHNSRLLSALERAWISARPTPSQTPATEARQTAETYVKNVQAILRLAAPAIGVVALQPTIATTAKPLAEEEQQMIRTKEIHVAGYIQRVRKTYVAMKTGLAEAEVAVVDLSDTLGTQPKLLFADECHFGDEAAERIAQDLAQFVSHQL